MAGGADRIRQRICLEGTAGLGYSGFLAIRRGAGSASFEQRSDLFPYAVIPLGAYVLMVAVEIQAACEYTTYNTKSEEKLHHDHCLKALPLGREISVKRGAGDWLYADWAENDTEWHMGLTIGRHRDEASPIEPIRPEVPRLPPAAAAGPLVRLPPP